MLIYHKCECQWCPYNENRDAHIWTTFRLRLTLNCPEKTPDLFVRIPGPRMIYYLIELQRIMDLVLNRYHSMDMRDIYIEIDKPYVVIMAVLCRILLQRVATVTIRRPSLEPHFESILFSTNGVRVSHHGCE
jgi:hypothetical protein